MHPETENFQSTWLLHDRNLTETGDNFVTMSCCRFQKTTSLIWFAVGFLTFPAIAFWKCQICLSIDLALLRAFPAISERSEKALNRVVFEFWEGTRAKFKNLLRALREQFPFICHFALRLLYIAIRGAIYNSNIPFVAIYYQYIPPQLYTQAIYHIRLYLCSRWFVKNAASCYIHLLYTTSCCILIIYSS